MTTLNPNTLNTAAIAYRQSEIIHGSGSYHDNVEAAITAYHNAESDYADSTAVLGIGEERLEAVEKAIEQRITGNDFLREKTKKFLDGILCDLLDGFEAHFANDTRWNLDRLIVSKAKLLVDAMLRGDEQVMQSCIGWSWNGSTRRAVLEAIGDYAAKAEVEQLRHDINEMEKRLKWREVR